MNETKKETAIAKKDENSVEFVPFGGTDKLRLTASMVRQFIAVPTKSGALPNERDCIRFIMLCRGKRANPFEVDCFLIGYDTKNGPSFSLVCGIELFLKRASVEPSYDGNESGVIVSGPENTIIERAGTMVMSGEKLIGGWARVFRKDRKQPEYKSVKFEVYNTGYSRWEKDPAGQIAKVALSQALRSAFATALGALYTQEEMERITESGGNLIQSRAPVSMPKELPEPIKEKPAEKSDPDMELAEPLSEPAGASMSENYLEQITEQITQAWADKGLPQGALLTLLREFCCQMCKYEYHNREKREGIHLTESLRNQLESLANAHDVSIDEMACKILHQAMNPDGQPLSEPAGASMSENYLEQITEQITQAWADKGLPQGALLTLLREFCCQMCKYEYHNREKREGIHLTESLRNQLESLANAHDVSIDEMACKILHQAMNPDGQPLEDIYGQNGGTKK
jgi:phage recombination protein Bet